MMITKARVGSKFLVYGLLAGIAFAPRSGKETRALAVQKVKDAFNSLRGNPPSTYRPEV
jgi:hypothetical protein